MLPSPTANHRPIKTPNGTAIGASYAWPGGQYCAIHTSRGVVGCGIYDVDSASEFGMAFAVARGTPEIPLREPEDLLPAKIVALSKPAEALGIRVGMTGAEALDLLMLAGGSGDPS
jgi:uncharacterized protein YunC (DUF1805 family)